MANSAGPKMISNTTQPALRPSYVFRGHNSAIHTLLFYRDNLRLLSGDSNGWIIVWDLPTRRAAAVWRGHGVDSSSPSASPSPRPSADASFSSSSKRPATASAVDEKDDEENMEADDEAEKEGAATSTNACVLGAIAWNQDQLITHGRDGKICVWSLSPSEEKDMSKILPLDGDENEVPRRAPWLRHVIAAPTLNFCSFASCIVPNKFVSAGNQSPEGGDGLLIASPSINETEIALFHLPSERRVGILRVPGSMERTGMVMALRVFLTSSEKPKVVVIAGYENGQTIVFRQASVDSRNGNDETLRSGWDIVYNSKPHVQGILSLDTLPVSQGDRDSEVERYFITSSIDALIVKHRLRLSTTSSTEQAKEEIVTKKNTRHSAQQSLTVRSDGRICATAGWDGRVRVYATKTCNELAVLKWHRESCYVVSFAPLIDSPGSATVPKFSGIVGQEGAEERQEKSRLGGALSEEEVIDVKVTKSIPRLSTVALKRITQTQTTHWLAAGAKDGKVTLWNVY